jgi:hypothetical protein
MFNQPIPLRQGSNQTVVFTMPAGFDLTGYTVALRVVWQGGSRLYGAGSGLSIAGLEIRWDYSLADSDAFPAGRVAKAELEFTQPDGKKFGGVTYLDVTEGIPNA